MRPVYLKTTETRLAGAERKIRFLERRSQLPEDHPDYDPGTGGGGIQFEVDNVGGWLDITTNDTDPDGYGIQVASTSPIFLQTDDALLIEAGAALAATASDFSFTSAVSGSDFQVAVTRTVQLAGGGNSISVYPDGTVGAGLGISLVSNSGAIVLSASEIGFYGTDTSPQAAHPTTLANVITILTDLGLCA